MIRHACPHQQVVCTLVELDLAADHVVRGCWESIGHSNPKLLSLRRRVHLYDLAIWVPLQTHLCWLYNGSKMVFRSLCWVSFHVINLVSLDKSLCWPAACFQPKVSCHQRDQREGSVCQKMVSVSDCWELCEVLTFLKYQCLEAWI